MQCLYSLDAEAADSGCNPESSEKTFPEDFVNLSVLNWKHGNWECQPEKLFNLNRSGVGSSLGMYNVKLVIKKLLHDIVASPVINEFNKLIYVPFQQTTNSVELAWYWLPWWREELLAL